MMCRRALWRWREIVAAAAASLATLSASRCGASLSDSADAVCRISAADGSCGSGCVFDIDAEWVYVLTAWHVVGDEAAVQCEFLRDGQASGKASRGRCCCDAAVDAAVVAVPAASLGVLPAAIPGPAGNGRSSRETPSRSGLRQRRLGDRLEGDVFSRRRG